MSNSKNNKIRHDKAINQNQSTNLKNANSNQNTAKTNTKTPNNTKNFQTTTKTTTETNKQTNSETRPLSSHHKIVQHEKNKQSPHQSQQKKDPVLSSKNAKKHKALTALIFIGGTIVIGIIATLIGGKMREGYTKPPAYPPDWLFSVIWPILYIMIGTASYLAYISVEENKKRRDDVIWYSIHLFFNFLWPLFYFRLDMLIFSCIWLLFNVITAIIVTYRYYRARLCSGILFTIYTLWLIYAMYLSLGITMLNLM